MWLRPCPDCNIGISIGPSSGIVSDTNGSNATDTDTQER